MKRLMAQFEMLFDLDHTLQGGRLGDVIERAIEELEQRPLPDWGTPGPANRRERVDGRITDFHYTPHLFPEMDPNLRLAHKLQFYLLPREVPRDAPMALAGVLESYCHLSGDLFGWEMLADGRFLIWIVDLAGHGVQSGVASAMLKVLISTLRRRGRIDEFVGALNDVFVATLRRRNLFATGFFMVVDADGSARYTSAGHPPVLVRRDGGRVDELSSNSLPIGMFPQLRYASAETSFAPGDMALLYTDGVVETSNERGEPFGVPRLRRELERGGRSPRELTDALYHRVAGFQDMDHLEDDVTFVAARMGRD